MEENGSPPPRFEFDEQRTFFQATLPAHPEYGALSALRDVAHLRALGEHAEANRRIESAWASNPSSAILAREMIRSYGERGEIGAAENVFKTFEVQGPTSAASHVANTLVEVLLEDGEERKAQELLKRDRQMTFGQDPIYAAILARRLRDSPAAHRYFEARRRRRLRRSPCIAGVRANEALVGARGLWPAAVCLAPPAAHRSPGLSWSGSFSSTRRRPATPGPGGSWRARSTGCGHRSEKSRMPIARRLTTCRPSDGSFESWRQYERLGADHQIRTSRNCGGCFRRRPTRNGER